MSTCRTDSPPRRIRGPVPPERWEESFGRDESDDRYEEISPYALRER
ncbi:hypothetical protein [Streptomyces acidiscabies]|uniref:Uncharacterized protein n=1 Tax=Streptomyces acidiscabies TaxID=42234 RepID=A0ABU4MC55_9ACTN|nr:hypothetical protein [Streptomyces acidiscabies]MDX3025412.1 hypothetical protein [Streptomyces acidiscabies]